MKIPQSISERLTQALAEGEADAAEAVTLEALTMKLDPLLVISDVIIPALTEVGRRFQAGEIFLPELMMAGEASERVTKHLEAAIAAQGRTTEPLGVVVLGTVQGDIHDIGKNIVATLLRAHGFRVIDLGRDVAPSAFVDSAKKENAQIVAMSSLMTTTRPLALSTLNLFKEIGVKDTFRLVVGGGCVTRGWAEEVGFDGYSEDAAGAVELCKTLVKASSPKR
jgi:5-methyltetrahydrofolate--homocysteine methyltransferase